VSFDICHRHGDTGRIARPWGFSVKHCDRLGSNWRETRDNDGSLESIPHSLKVACSRPSLWHDIHCFKFRCNKAALFVTIQLYCGPGSSVGITTGYGLDGSGIESPWGGGDVQTYRPALGPTHPASCTMGTGSFPGVKRGRGVTLTPHTLLMPWSRKSRAIPLLLLWAVRTVQSLSACKRVHFTLTFTLPLYCWLLSFRLQPVEAAHTSDTFTGECLWLSSPVNLMANVVVKPWN